MQCNSFWYCSRKCGKSIFVKEHVKECAQALAARRQHAEKLKEDEDFDMSYEVGENVICQTGSSWDSWQPAVVTAIRNTTYHQSGYHCRLTVDGRSVFKYVYNENDNIRRHDFNLDNHLEVLLHHLSWRASPDLLQRIIDAHSMDIRLVGPKMLFACVRYNVTETLKWLVDVQGVSLESCDESGRNCLLLAVHHKQVDIISLLMKLYPTVCASRLFRGVDHRK